MYERSSVRPLGEVCWSTLPLVSGVGLPIPPVKHVRVRALRAAPRQRLCLFVSSSPGYILALGPLVFVSVFDVWLAKFTTRQAYVVNLVSVGVVAFGCTGSYYGNLQRNDDHADETTALHLVLY